VPICWPQFNQRVIDGRALPKHGFARNLPWRLTDQQSSPTRASARLTLNEATAQRSDWSFAFEAHLLVALEPAALTVEFEVHNRDTQALGFHLALHTYFAVSDVRQTTLHGLEGAPYTEFAAHAPKPSATATDAAPLGFGLETDRVYAHAPRALVLREGERALQIESSESLCDTVVWNPGAALCATLKDMPADGWKQMLCVEAAAIEQPVRLEAGGVWRGWQRMQVVR
jgi:glucose-6-phosphate 1-epimerase